MGRKISHWAFFIYFSLSLSLSLSLSPSSYSHFQLCNSKKRLSLLSFSHSSKTFSNHFQSIFSPLVSDCHTHYRHCPLNILTSIFWHSPFFSPFPFPFSNQYFFHIFFLTPTFLSFFISFLLFSLLFVQIFNSFLTF